VEKQEKATEDSLRPQRVAQVDELQTTLEAALEELKSQRADLEQKEKDQQQKEPPAQ
jgi:hypothetical protein